MGVCAFQLGDDDIAIRLYSDALDYDPSRLDCYYLRGLVWYRERHFDEAEQDFLAFYDKARKGSSLPDTFWGDLGLLEGQLKDYDLGTAALDHSLAAYPADVSSRQEVGYQNLRWVRNKESKEAFREATDFYTEVLPYLTGEDAREYAAARHMTKQDYTRLDKVFGFEAYLNKTDLGTASSQSAPVSTIEGALPSQAGIYGSYRPPVIGFRDERTLDIFGRVMANLEPHSFQLDEKSYQGSVGANYKPFVSQNINTSIERLFVIGENSENNWLWRNMGAYERGEKPQREEDMWWYRKLYMELSFYLDDPRRWIYFVDGRLGPMFELKDKVMLTIPRLLAIGRYQSNDDSGLGTYSMIGLGANLRVLEQERQYTTERWYMDLYVDYVWGWFSKTPEGEDGRSFDGVMFGVNFVK